MTTVLLEQYRGFARYNDRFNRQLYELVARLPAPERTRERGAFFGSIQATLHHILAADRIWLGRFAAAGHDFAALEEAELAYDIQAANDAGPDAFTELSASRIATDQVITAWVEDLNEEILASVFKYANSKGVVREHALWIAVTHMFNHQTHHRGQVTTLLSQLGHDPGVTDFLVHVLG